MHKIESLQDIFNNFSEFRDLEFCYRDGEWFVTGNNGESQALTKSFPTTLVDCGMLVLQDVIMSHHAYRTYKLHSCLVSYFEIPKIKRALYKAITLLQTKRSFKSVKDIERFLGDNDYTTCRTEIPSFACYWSSCKYDRAFQIEDPTKSFELSIRYYAIADNLVKKNNLIRSFLRAAGNLFYPEIPYPKATKLSTSKYYFSNEKGGYTFNRMLWEEEYEFFEETILQKLRKDIHG